MDDNLKQMVIKTERVKALNEITYLMNEKIKETLKERTSYDLSMKERYVDARELNSLVLQILKKTITDIQNKLMDSVIRAEHLRTNVNMVVSEDAIMCECKTLMDKLKQMEKNKKKKEERNE